MKKNIILAAVLVAAVGVGLYFLLRVDSEPAEAGESVRIGRKAPTAKSAAGSPVKRRIAPRERLSRADAKQLLVKELSFDPDEEARLSADQRALLAEIRKVLDEEDCAGLIRIVQKMQKSEEWPDGIPIAIRKAAIDALAWFGGNCIPEMLGFVHDPDSEVQEAAYDAYEQALFDANGDLELSQLVLAASKVIDDFDAMDSMMMWMNDMRPSRQVETIKEIWKSGTPSAKRALSENMEFILGEEGIDTPEKLDEWYNDPSGDNRDDDDAEDFYGPQKD